MDLEEYNKIKNLTYLEYCDYLQSKYGKSKYDYMTRNWNKNPKVTRTKEGLFAHHKYEDHAILLSDKDHAMKNPFEWQEAENIIYCNYLEHLYLHILICEYPAPKRNKMEMVGIGGAINYLIPELNDLYSGFELKQSWKINCFNIVKNNEGTYLTLINRLRGNKNLIEQLNTTNNVFESTGEMINTLPDELFLRSFNEQFGTWSKSRNKRIFDKIIETTNNFKGLTDTHIINLFKYGVKNKHIIEYADIVKDEIGLEQALVIGLQNLEKYGYRLEDAAFGISIYFENKYWEGVSNEYNKRKLYLR